MQKNIPSIQHDGSLTLFLKLNGSMCNLHCAYCYPHVSSSRDAMIKATSVNDTLRYLSGFRNLHHTLIVFHGGEPLLTPIDDVRAILEYIFSSYKHQPNVQFQTNGTLLDRQWLDLFHGYQPGVSLSVSLDPTGQKDFRFNHAPALRRRVLENLVESTRYIQNVGVVSVAHRYNRDTFIPFIDELIECHVHGLTISKLQDPERTLGNAYLSENEYVDLLLGTGRYWIAQQRYTRIRLQPFSSLLARGGSRICRYLADERKCSMFRTFYNGDMQSGFCDHVRQEELPCCPERCKTCDIYQDCGGGCFLEEKDPTFCDARHRLFEAIHSIKR